MSLQGMWPAVGPPRKLEVKTGILQLQVGRTAGAVDLQQTLLRSLRSMATKRKPHSNMYRTREAPSCDAALQNRLRSICEVYASDAAADEQLAGQMLRPNSGRTGSKAQLPKAPPQATYLVRTLLPRLSCNTDMHSARRRHSRLSSRMLRTHTKP